MTALGRLSSILRQIVAQVPVIADARATISDCDTKIQRYQAALDAGADPSIVSNWIAQTQAERTRAETELHTGPPPHHAE